MHSQLEAEEARRCALCGESAPVIGSILCRPCQAADVRRTRKLYGLRAARDLAFFYRSRTWAAE